MKDYLSLNLRELPYFRALMRAVEASFYQQINLPEPLLDVGCGDGHFASVAFDHKVSMGLDPAFASLRETSTRGCYHWLSQADGKSMPFRDGAFASAISNSVLEHIPGVENVLQEISRVLQHGAPFVFCGPNDHFISALSVSYFLDQINFPGLAKRYRLFFNRISRHYNSDPPDVWSARLEQAGLTLDQYWNYYPPDALHVTEWGHLFGLPSLVWKKIFGRWILVPTEWNLKLTEVYTRKHYYPTSCADGVCTFYLAHRN